MYAHRLSTLPALLLVLAAPVPSPGATAPSPAPTALPEVLTSGAPLSANPGKTSAETFYLYGGPGSNEGTFEDPSGLPDPQGWMGVDGTDHLDYWQVSTFNAANLNDHGAGNHAMWAGRTAEQEPLWSSAPGYGNAWNEKLLWQGTAPDPDADTEVTLEFWFNYDCEPGYDYLHVEWNSGGGWTSRLSIGGYNYVFVPPGEHFLQTWTVPVAAYGGPDNDQVQLRIRFSADGAVSNEDGLGLAAAGGAQVDDIRVAFGGIDVSFADFEPGGGDGGWFPDYDIVGDFSKIFVGLTDLDPCVSNFSAQYTFIDDGTPPNNAPGRSTGGALNPSFDYGTPGGWVVNNDGGLRADGISSLDNEIWSPAIEWDQPGTADDGTNLRTWLFYEVFDHRPSEFRATDAYRVRASLDGGATWETWSPRQYLFDGVAQFAVYRNRAFDITPLVPPGTTHVQVALRCFSFSFHPPFTTPAPFYDNVSLLKQRSGPIISVDVRYLLRDGFPTNGSIDVSSQAARDALDIPLGRAGGVIPRRPLSATITPVDPDEVLDVNKLEAVWILEQNPLFEDTIRQLPAGTTVIGPSARGWVQVSGRVTGQPVFGYENDYEFPFPQADFFYPGDVLRYYVRAEDSGGLVSTVPEDVGGFEANDAFDRRFLVRGLPTLTSPAGAQPSILFVDYSDDTSIQPYLVEMAQIGLHEGFEYDTYHPRYLESGSGIGGAGYHGANSGQLAGYSRILLVGRISRGRPEDFQVLEDWRAEPGDHLAAFFFDDLEMYALTTDQTEDLRAQLGVDWIDGDVSNDIDGQRNPAALPTEAPFATAFEVGGLCPIPRLFDRIAPRPGAVAAHGFQMAGNLGTPYPGIAASVVHDRVDTENDRIIDVTFPFELESIRTLPGSNLGGRSAAAVLLEETLGLLGAPPAGTPTSARPADLPGIHELKRAPNPFNPATTISFVLGREGPCTVTVSSLRGQRVAVLLEGVRSAGRHEVIWNGTDDRGFAVASGVYLVTVLANGERRSVKVALLE